MKIYELKWQDNMLYVAYSVNGGKIQYMRAFINENGNGEKYLSI